MEMIEEGEVLIKIIFGKKIGDIAQLVERVLCKHKVAGSIPAISMYGRLSEWSKEADLSSVMQCMRGFEPHIYH
tara:strand:- start:2226 stop:2447 length:222 start_codon:yes stop_codon:yes gene_type:complete